MCIAAVLTMALMLAVPCFAPAYAGSRAEVPVKISFTGSNLPQETFTVQMKGDGLTDPVTASLTLSTETPSGMLSLDLGELEAGTYVYELKEIAGRNPDITYSDKTYTYYIEVRGDGTIQQRAVNADDPDDKPDEVEFTNSYVRTSKDEVIGDPPVRVRKDISGKKPETAEKFVFIMKPENPDYPLPDVEAAGSGVIRDGVAEVYLNGEGEVEIGNITFTEEGVYRYFVSEKDTAIDGYNYDDARFTVIYNVSRDQNGQLTCSRSIIKDKEGVTDECRFDNIYDPDPATRILRRGVKTGDPAIMWPLTIVCIACMITIALMLDRRNRREAGRGKK